MGLQGNQSVPWAAGSLPGWGRLIDCFTYWDCRFYGNCIGMVSVVEICKYTLQYVLLVQIKRKSRPPLLCLSLLSLLCSSLLPLQTFQYGLFSVQNKLISHASSVLWKSFSIGIFSGFVMTQRFGYIGIGVLGFFVMFWFFLQCSTVSH